MQLDQHSLNKATGRLVPVLLIIIAVILSVYALKITKPVTLPLAFAFFIAVLADPLQAGLAKYVPQWVAMMGVLLVLAGILGVFAGAVELSLERLEPRLPAYSDRLQALADTAQSWLASYGLPTSPGSQSDGAIAQLLQQAIGGVQSLLTAVSLLVLVASFLALLLLEVGKYRDRTLQAFPAGVGEHIVHAVGNMGAKLRRYFLVVAFTSLLTGLLTWGVVSHFGHWSGFYVGAARLCPQLYSDPGVTDCSDRASTGGDAVPRSGDRSGDAGGFSHHSDDPRQFCRS